MLEWIAAIGDAIGAIVSFFSSFFTGILQVFQLVGESISFMSMVWVLVPPVVVVFGLAGLGVVVFFQLIGR